jgi:succinate-acetate transporter protein
MTTFVLNVVNANWFAAGAGSVVVALALFYGGLAQLLAGMWEFRAGNTFGATAFTSFGAFWLSYAAINIPGTGIAASLVATNQLHPAVGIFLVAWAIFTAIMFLGSLRTNIGLMLLFALLALTLLALGLNELTANGDVNGAFKLIGGYLGIITAIVAWYNALAGLLNSGKSAFTLPLGPRP